MEISKTLRLQSLAVGVVLLAFLTGASKCTHGESVPITILHTNDLHYSLHPPRGDEFGLGGVARLSTLMKQRRALHANSVTLDAGDWSEGNWYYNIDAGRRMLEIFAKMGMDAAVVGNHDYLAGPEGLWTVVRDAAVPVSMLGANFDVSRYPRAEEFLRYVAPTAIFERGGLKIGVIGLSTVDYVYSFWLEPVRAQEPIAVAQQLAEALRPQVDVLIVLSHNSFNTNQQIARTVLGVDAVISGHSHEKLGKAVLIENAGRQVPVVETGSWGRFLGELKLNVDPVSKSVTFDSYALQPVTSDLPEDPEVVAIVEDADRALAEFAKRNPDEVVASTEIDLHHDEGRIASLGHLSTKAMQSAANATASLDILSLTGVKVARGPLTVRDLHDVAPHIYDFKRMKEWTVKVWTARGQDLALIMNVIYLANFLPLDGTGFFVHSGIEVDWQPKDEDHAVPSIREMRVGGVKFDPTRSYDVAVTDGVLLALREVNEKFFLDLDLSQVVDTGVEASSAVIDYAATHSPLTEADLLEGTRGSPVTADPGVMHYGINLSADGDVLEVRLANEGLSPLGPTGVSCEVGAANEPVLYGTSEQKWVALDSRSVSGLGPRGRSTLSLDWLFQTPGIYPVRCSIESAENGYRGNDSATTVVRVRESR